MASPDPSGPCARSHGRPTATHEPEPDHDDPLDPLARRRAQLAPPAGVPSPPPVTPPPVAPPAAHAAATVRAASLEELLPQLVRRVAWSSEQGRGTVRLEVGAGSLAGAVLTVHADAGAVRVELVAPPGTVTSGWGDRIRDRLRARGLDVHAVEVS